MSTARARSEAGFTLVEMLAAIAILGIIMLPLGGAFSVGFRTLNDTSNRLRSSTDAQLLTVHFPADVQSAAEAVASATGAGITCTNAQNPKLMLTDGSALKIVYGVRAIGDGFQLERYDCTSGTVTKTTVVARNLPATTSVVPIRVPVTGTFVGASLRLTEKTTPSDTTAFDFTVTGRKRAS